jgi:hypothetical protein
MIGFSFVLAVGLSFIDVAGEVAQVETQPPATDQFLIVPLRIHILKSPKLALADCKLGDGDVNKVVRDLNTIWGKAGIFVGIESIIREPAAQPDRFRVLIRSRRAVVSGFLDNEPRDRGDCREVRDRKLVKPIAGSCKMVLRR